MRRGSNLPPHPGRLGKKTGQLKLHGKNLKHWGALLKAYVSVLRRKTLNRNLEAVQSEYQNTWGGLSAQATRLRTLEEFLRLVGNAAGPELHMRNHGLAWGANDVSRQYINGIQRTLIKNFSRITSVLEFGSGSGRNLLALKNQNPTWEVRGYELTKEGVGIAGRLAKKFSLPITVRQKNLWDLSGTPEADVGFTCFALEQVNCGVSDAARLLQKILSKVRHGIVLLEPLVEYYPQTIRGWFARQEHRKVGYCSNMGRACEKLAREGLVRIRRYSYPDSHNPLMFPQLVILTKVRATSRRQHGKKRDSLGDHGRWPRLANRRNGNLTRRQRPNNRG
jgi:hypothetical protein